MRIQNGAITHYTIEAPKKINRESENNVEEIEPRNKSYFDLFDNNFNTNDTTSELTLLDLDTFDGSSTSDDYGDDKSESDLEIDPSTGFRYIPISRFNDPKFSPTLPKARPCVDTPHVHDSLPWFSPLLENYKSNYVWSYTEDLKSAKHNNILEDTQSLSQNKVCSKLEKEVHTALSSIIQNSIKNQHDKEEQEALLLVRIKLMEIYEYKLNCLYIASEYEIKSNWQDIALVSVSDFLDKLLVKYVCKLEQLRQTKNSSGAGKNLAKTLCKVISTSFHKSLIDLSHQLSSKSNDGVIIINKNNLQNLITHKKARHRLALHALRDGNISFTPSIQEPVRSRIILNTKMLEKPTRSETLKAAQNFLINTISQSSSPVKKHWSFASISKTVSDKETIKSKNIVYKFKSKKLQVKWCTKKQMKSIPKKLHFNSEMISCSDKYMGFYPNEEYTKEQILHKKNIVLDIFESHKNVLNSGTLGFSGSPIHKTYLKSFISQDKIKTFRQILETDLNDISKNINFDSNFIDNISNLKRKENILNDYHNNIDKINKILNSLETKNRVYNLSCSENIIPNSKQLWNSNSISSKYIKKNLFLNRFGSSVNSFNQKHKFKSGLLNIKYKNTKLIKNILYNYLGKTRVQLPATRCSVIRRRKKFSQLFDNLPYCNLRYIIGNNFNKILCKQYLELYKELISPNNLHNNDIFNADYCKMTSSCSKNVKAYKYNELDENKLIKQSYKYKFYNQIYKQANPLLSNSNILKKKISNDQLTNKINLLSYSHRNNLLKDNFLDNVLSKNDSINVSLIFADSKNSKNMLNKNDKVLKRQESDNTISLVTPRRSSKSDLKTQNLKNTNHLISLSSRYKESNVNSNTIKNSPEIPNISTKKQNTSGVSSKNNIKNSDQILRNEEYKNEVNIKNQSTLINQRIKSSITKKNSIPTDNTKSIINSMNKCNLSSGKKLSRSTSVNTKKLTPINTTKKLSLNKKEYISCNITNKSDSVTLQNDNIQDQIIDLYSIDSSGMKEYNHQSDKNTFSKTVNSNISNSTNTTINISKVSRTPSLKSKLSSIQNGSESSNGSYNLTKQLLSSNKSSNSSSISKKRKLDEPNTCITKTVDNTVDFLQENISMDSFQQLKSNNSKSSLIRSMKDSPVINTSTIKKTTSKKRNSTVMSIDKDSSLLSTRSSESNEYDLFNNSKTKKPIEINKENTSYCDSSNDQVGTINSLVDESLKQTVSKSNRSSISSGLKSVKKKHSNSIPEDSKTVQVFNSIELPIFKYIEHAIEQIPEPTITNSSTSRKSSKARSIKTETIQNRYQNNQDINIQDQGYISTTNTSAIDKIGSVISESNDSSSMIINSEELQSTEYNLAMKETAEVNFKLKHRTETKNSLSKNKIISSTNKKIDTSESLLNEAQQLLDCNNSFKSDNDKPESDNKIILNNKLSRKSSGSKLSLKINENTLKSDSFSNKSSNSSYEVSNIQSKRNSTQSSINTKLPENLLQSVKDVHIENEKYNLVDEKSSLNSTKKRDSTKSLKSQKVFIESEQLNLQDETEELNNLNLLGSSFSVINKTSISEIPGSIPKKDIQIEDNSSEKHLVSSEKEILNSEVKQVKKEYDSLSRNQSKNTCKSPRRKSASKPILNTDNISNLDTQTILLKKNTCNFLDKICNPPSDVKKSPANKLKVSVKNDSNIIISETLINIDTIDSSTCNKSSTIETYKADYHYIPLESNKNEIAISSTNSSNLDISKRRNSKSKSKRLLTAENSIIPNHNEIDNTNITKNSTSSEPVYESEQIHINEVDNIDITNLELLPNLSVDIVQDQLNSISKPQKRSIKSNSSIKRNSTSSKISKNSEPVSILVDNSQQQKIKNTLNTSGSGKKKNTTNITSINKDTITSEKSIFETDSPDINTEIDQNDKKDYLEDTLESETLLSTNILPSLDLSNNQNTIDKPQDTAELEELCETLLDDINIHLPAGLGVVKSVQHNTEHDFKAKTEDITNSTRYLMSIKTSTPGTAVSSTIQLLRRKILGPTSIVTAMVMPKLPSLVYIVTTNILQLKEEVKSIPELKAFTLKPAAASEISVELRENLRSNREGSANSLCVDYGRERFWLDPGSMVKISKGIYTGDLAQVVGHDTSNLILSLKPRLDVQRICSDLGINTAIPAEIAGQLSLSSTAKLVLSNNSQVIDQALEISFGKLFLPAIYNDQAFIAEERLKILDYMTDILKKFNQHCFLRENAIQFSPIRVEQISNAIYEGIDIKNAISLLVKAQELKAGLHVTLDSLPDIPGQLAALKKLWDLTNSSNRPHTALFSEFLPEVLKLAPFAKWSEVKRNKQTKDCTLVEKNNTQESCNKVYFYLSNTLSAKMLKKTTCVTKQVDQLSQKKKSQKKIAHKSLDYVSEDSIDEMNSFYSDIKKTISFPDNAESTGVLHYLRARLLMVFCGSTLLADIKPVDAILLPPADISTLLYDWLHEVIMNESNMSSTLLSGCSLPSVRACTFDNSMTHQEKWSLIQEAIQKDCRRWTESAVLGSCNFADSDISSMKSIPSNCKGSQVPKSAYRKPIHIQKNNIFDVTEADMKKLKYSMYSCYDNVSPNQVHWSTNDLLSDSLYDLSPCSAGELIVQGSYQDMKANKPLNKDLKNSLDRVTNDSLNNFYIKTDYEVTKSNYLTEHDSYPNKMSYCSYTGKNKNIFHKNNLLQNSILENQISLNKPRYKCSKNSKTIFTRSKLKIPYNGLQHQKHSAEHLLQFASGSSVISVSGQKQPCLVPTRDGFLGQARATDSTVILLLTVENVRVVCGTVYAVVSESLYILVNAKCAGLVNQEFAVDLLSAEYVLVEKGQVLSDPIQLTELQLLRASDMADSVPWYADLHHLLAAREGTVQARWLRDGLAPSIISNVLTQREHIDPRNFQGSYKDYSSKDNVHLQPNISLSSSVVTPIKKKNRFSSECSSKDDQYSSVEQTWPSEVSSGCIPEDGLETSGSTYSEYESVDTYSANISTTKRKHYESMDDNSSKRKFGSSAAQSLRGLDAFNQYNNHSNNLHRKNESPYKKAFLQSDSSKNCDDDYKSQKLNSTSKSKQSKGAKDYSKNQSSRHTFASESLYKRYPSNKWDLSSQSLIVSSPKVSDIKYSSESIKNLLTSCNLSDQETFNILLGLSKEKSRTNHNCKDFLNAEISTTKESLYKKYSNDSEFCHEVLSRFGNFASSNMLSPLIQRDIRLKLTQKRQVVLQEAHAAFLRRPGLKAPLGLKLLARGSCAALHKHLAAQVLCQVRASMDQCVKIKERKIQMWDILENHDISSLFPEPRSFPFGLLGPSADGDYRSFEHGSAAVICAFPSYRQFLSDPTILIKDLVQNII